MTIINKSKFLQLSYYSKSKYDFKFMVVCPHSFEGLIFLQQYPKLIDLIQLNNFELTRYFAIEQDFGTKELGHAIANICYHEHGIPTLVVEPLFPRAVIDPGRFSPHCLRNIIDYSQHPQLKKEFLNIHADYLNTLNKLVKSLNNHDGIALDLHSMSTYSPAASPKTYAEAILETPYNLTEYIDAYTFSHKNGTKREIELFSGLAIDDVFADSKFTHNVDKMLKHKELDIEYDMPYLVAPHLIGFYLMRTTKAVCIDIPKDYLSMQETSSEHYNLSDLLLDYQKLDTLADCLAKAAILTLKGEKK